MTTLTNLKSGLLTFSKITCAIALFASHAGAAKLSEKQREIRLKHAHELLGRYYKKSSVKGGESIPKINSAIYHWTRDHLPAKFKDQSGKIAQTIIDVSTQHQFDPVFLMSVIEGESSWRPDKVGGVGEIGLMQLRPSTGKWMAKKAGLKWKNDRQLFDPCSNIKIGAAYLSYLRDRFDDHARLYLAAYNMGQTNVDEALDKKIWPKDYPIHVMKRYVAFYENFGGAFKASPKVTTKLVKKNLVARKSPIQIQVVLKPSATKKVYERTGFDDDIFFDIDKLTRSEDDVNDVKTDKTVDSDLDSDLKNGSGSASTSLGRPGRS